MPAADNFILMGDAETQERASFDRNNPIRNAGERPFKKVPGWFLQRARPAFVSFPEQKMEEEP